VSRPDGDRPPTVETVRAQMAALLARPATGSPSHLRALPHLQRADWVLLRPQLSAPLQADLTALRSAPILLNFDRRPAGLSLARIRQAERGVGEHAITLFDTGDTFVSDMSHIFFDGIWSVALAEILTNQAIAWATYLHLLPPVTAADNGAVPANGLPAGAAPTVRHLPCRLTPADYALIDARQRVTAEASAETERVDVRAIMTLRTLFKQRSDLLQLTVNDLLLLYRAIHALTYVPSAALRQRLDSLHASPQTRAAAEHVLTAVSDRTSPSILIPVDASQYAPRARVHPMTLVVPLEALGLLELHAQTLAAWQRRRAEGTAEAEAAFDAQQQHYLATLAGLSELLSRLKQVAAAGESTSVGTIRLLAHLPTPVQRLLDKIPHQFDVLNDLIKGREVFSNVGAVVPDSTLTRFLTAKDDNEHKTLAWAIITDANKVMRITLRDFRPHVARLVRLGEQALADAVAQEYLDAYALGFNQFVADLLLIVRAGRRPARRGENGV
ncbi:MAG: hypothetical protein KC425_04580, partial [Anaerolineales bacterium]|nr:hypothetical protein [Anaerolineales bacterium]